MATLYLVLAVVCIFLLGFLASFVLNTKSRFTALRKKKLSTLKNGDKSTIVAFFHPYWYDPSLTFVNCVL